MELEKKIRWLLEQPLPMSKKELVERYNGTRTEIESGIEAAIETGNLWLSGPMQDEDSTIVHKGVVVPKGVA